MKKFLIASTALIMVGLVSSEVMAADKIKLTLGGFSKWWVTVQSQDDDFTRATGASYNDVDIKGDNEIYFLGETTLDNGLTVGVRIEMEAGGQTDSDSDIIDTSFVYLESTYGKLVLGTYVGVTSWISLNAPDAAGNWAEVGQATEGLLVAIPAGLYGINPGDNTSSVPSMTGDDKADKISYFTPTMAGFTFGATYSPNGTEDNRGPTDLNSPGATSFPMYQETYSGIVNYTEQFDDVGVKLYAAAMTAAINGGSTVPGGGTIGYTTLGNSPSNKLNAYAGGANFTYAGFTIGGAYRHNDFDYGDLLPTSTSFAGNAFDIGVMYTSGPWSTSVAYYQSEVEAEVSNPNDDEMRFYQASANYTLSPGVDLQGSLGYAEFKGENRNNPADNNEGWFFMSGIALAF